MADSIQVNDIGTIFELTITDQNLAVNISAATVKNIIFMRPKTKLIPADTIIRTASFSTNGSDGKVIYTTIAGDIDRAGTYSVQIQIVLPDFNGRSDVKTFVVKPNL